MHGRAQRFLDFIATKAVANYSFEAPLAA